MKPKASPHHHSAVHLTLKYTVQQTEQEDFCYARQLFHFLYFITCNFEAMLGTHACKIVISDKSRGMLNYWKINQILSKQLYPSCCSKHTYSLSSARTVYPL